MGSGFLGGRVSVLSQMHLVHNYSCYYANYAAESLRKEIFISMWGPDAEDGLQSATLRAGFAFLQPAAQLGGTR